MTRTPNDQRSDVKNPTSDEHQDMLDNRSRQIKQSTEAGNKQQREGDPQVSVPPDMPKE